jgi:hypothetical protein
MALQDYFDKTVVVQKKTSTPNGFGGFAETWVKDFDLDCLIDYLTGRKGEIARQYQEDTTHILMANVGANIAIDNRINDNGDIYRVLHYDEPFKKHSETLLQKVGVDNG